MHAAALENLKAPEQEILLIGTYCLRKEGKLIELVSSTVGWLNDEKRRFVDVHLEMSEHTTDVLEQHDLAQRITDAIVTRTRSDQQANYFKAAFSADIATQASRCALR